MSGRFASVCVLAGRAGRAALRWVPARAGRAALALALAGVLAAFVPGAAWADDEGAHDALDLQSVENTVNPQQMPDNSFLYDTSIYDLENADLTYDNRTVQVTGEVVGDALVDGLDGSQAWITLASADPVKEGSVSVLVSMDQLALVDTFGGYNRTGTILQVQGTFHLACSAHDGTSDIHASQVSATTPGRTTPDVFDPDDFVPGMLLVGAALALTVVYYVLSERQR